MSMGIDNVDTSANIDELLEKIEDALDKGTSLAFLGKTVVDAKSIRVFIEDIRLNMPTVIENAYRITEDRSRIISSAKAEAEETVAEAKKRAEMLTNKAKKKVDDYLTKSEEYSVKVMSKAEYDSKEMLHDAQEQAAKMIDEHEITRQAKSYAVQIKKKAEDEITAQLNEATLKSEEMIAKAKKWSGEIRIAASDFADDIIKSTENALSSSLEEIREAKKSLHSAINGDAQ